MTPLTRAFCEDLRDIIHEDALVDGHTERRFASKVQLQKILDVNCVEKVLECDCPNCSSLRAVVPACNSRDVVKWVTNSALRSFALLACSGCAQLIRGFFAGDYNDQKIINQKLHHLKSDNIAGIFWPLLLAKDPRWSRRLAHDVASRRYQFFIRTINDRVTSPTELQSFPADSIIPFTKEKSIGHGTFGKVFEIEIYDEYKDFQSFNNTVPLVRKEIERANQPRLYEELAILLFVRSLNDDHVVRLVTAYEHGSKINYIFPKAMTNLDDFLHSSADWSETPYSDVADHPLWEETLAILRVLHRIYNDIYQTTSGKQIRLYHFDLKPANILVDTVNGKPQLQMADFGLSRFRVAATQADTSRIVGHGGTPSYAPPEIDDPRHQRNHRYDIWSIGCILLEICAFVIHGTAGVEALDNVRFTEEPLRNGNEDDYFWHVNEHGRPEIKPSVVAWMRQMQTAGKNHDPKVAKFMTDMINLSEEMLQVNVSERLDAETAQNKLSGILSDARTVPDGPSSYADSDIVDDEPLGSVAIGSDKLDSIARVSCKYGLFFDNIRPRLFENALGVLSLQLWSNTSLKREIELGDRKSIALVPSPAIAKENKIDLHIKMIQDPRRRVVTFYLSSGMSAAIFQSVLLGQAARGYNAEGQRSFALKSIQVSQRTGGLGRMLKFNKKRTDHWLGWGKPIAVQLWSERSFKDPEAVAKLRPRRPSPRFYFGVPARRLVIFCEKALVIIRFAKNARLEKPHDKYTGTQHRIVPTDRSPSSSDPSFEVSVLTSSGRVAYSVPLDIEEFANMEEETSFECTTLGFELKSRNDWSDFQRKYRLMKKEWSDEYDSMRQERVVGAVERGWAPAGL